jgi:hypothetical protein
LVEDEIEQAAAAGFLEKLRYGREFVHLTLSIAWGEAPGATRKAPVGRTRSGGFLVGLDFACDSIGEFGLGEL